MPTQAQNFTTDPLWTGRRFGIEMEMRKRRADGSHMSGTDLNRALSAACHEPVHGNGNYYTSQHQGQAWEVKYDTTCGYEVASVPMMMDENGHCAELKRGCDAIMGLRPQLDASCGVHVHIDCHDFTWKQVQKAMALWARFEPFFFSMVADSRKGNSYTPALRAETWEGAHNGDQRMERIRRGVASRYEDRAVGEAGLRQKLDACLNATTERQFERATNSIGRYGSMRTQLFWQARRVEIRLHSATVNYDKIRRWVTLCLSVFGRVKAADCGKAPRLGPRIRPLTRPVGFGTKYVLAMLGIGPGGYNGELWFNQEVEERTMPVYNDLVEWIPSRIRKFANGSNG